jgi:CRP-like cAMP-binding protein
MIPSVHDAWPMHNRIILGTEPEAQMFIAERSEIRPLVQGATLYRMGEPVTHAIFPQLGILSMLADMSNGRSVEKASIGNEGFVGFTYLMGCPASISRIDVQVPGYASWVAIDHLNEAMGRFEGVRRIMLLYAAGFIVQLLENVACSTVHRADQRVAGWLLLAHDRMLRSRFPMTQDALAAALGLRRATVSQICSDLARSKAIAYSRGMISVLDRAAMRAHACECYDRIAAATIASKAP